MTYVLDSLAEQLKAIPGLAGDARGDGSPAAGSPARREQIGASAAVRPFVEQARTLAGLRMVAVEDHMATLGLLTRQPSTIYSVYSVARVVAELSARAWWLLDPSLTGTQRAGRVVHEHLFSHQERAKLAAVDDEFESDDLEKAQQLRQDAAAARIEPADRPTATGLVDAIMADDYDDGQFGAFVYKMLSAYSHGTIYAIAELVHEVPGSQADELGTVPAHVTTDYRYETHALGMAFMPFLRAAQRQLVYNGWDTNGSYDGALKQILAELHRLMQLPHTDAHGTSWREPPSLR